jgi:hypothetical protein
VVDYALYRDPFAGDPEIIEVRNARKYILDPDLKAPYTINFNIAAERQLPKGLVGTLSYIHTIGPASFNVNMFLSKTSASASAKGRLRRLGKGAPVLVVDVVQGAASRLA